MKLWISFLMMFSMGRRDGKYTGYERGRDGMKYKDAMEYMEEMGKYGSVLGLEGMRELCRRLGDPQQELKFVHIAGTNGKGSVLAYVSTALQCAGYRVGRYLSPVIFEYRERIQVNGRYITQKGFCECLEQIRTAAGEMAAEGFAHPTAFEIETAAAFLYFKQKSCDIVVLETGLGGGLDATNVIPPPEAAVFASISMDHIQLLGDTLEEIAEKKAGIIKRGCPVISMGQLPEAEGVLRARAEENGCTFCMLDEGRIRKVRYGLERQRFSYGGLQDLEISLAGQHQVRNAALAVEVLRMLGERGFAVPEKRLRQGLLQTEWRGRFDIIGKKPYFIADGAHNEDGAKKLAESLRFYFTNKKIVYIMGVLRDKEYHRMIRATFELAEHIVTVTPPGSPRALHACELAGEVRRYHPSVTAADSIEEAVELSYLLADQGSVIVAFGSLSYLGALIRAVENRDKGMVV
ncbi:MAG: bifunctional folylpolyglutamate synthase/dihydrofolate synthase [Kineothrix sp.]